MSTTKSSSSHVTNEKQHRQNVQLLNTNSRVLPRNSAITETAKPVNEFSTDQADNEGYFLNTDAILIF